MSIGLQRGTVQLQPYDQQWETEFQVEKQRLVEMLDNFVIGIEHVGSTAVPGLDAKPLIDILVAVDNIDGVSKYRQTLTKLGYEYMPERTSVVRSFFPKGPRKCRSHHLSFVRTDSSEWRDTIAFRDLLRTDATTRASYQKLKRNLAERYKDDRYAYTAGKAEFIEMTLKKINESL